MGVARAQLLAHAETALAEQGVSWGGVERDSDKAMGIEHVLPTLRAFHSTGGLWVGKFPKTVTTQRRSREGSVEVAGPAGSVAATELAFGHEMTANMRIEHYSDGASA